LKRYAFAAMAAADKDGSLGPPSLAAQPGPGSPPEHQAGVRPEGGPDREPHLAGPVAAEPVSRTELNAWRRGFTPQAEIWNGRLAMLGLSVGLTVLLIARLAAR
jgi:hypothetical protein